MSHHITIIGAGISGLIAGILLKRHGIDVSIYEKRCETVLQGGSLGIWPNGSQVLLDLPCAQTILSIAGKTPGEYLGDASGNTLTQTPIDLVLQVNGSPFLAFCRAELHQVLTQEFGKERIRYNKRCIDIKQDNQKTYAHFNDGEIVESDLVIAADGIFSNIRPLLFPQSSLNYAGYIFLGGIFEFAQQKLPKHHFIWGQNRFCLTLPISNERYLLYFVRPFPSGKLKLDATTQQDQIKLFRTWSKEADVILDAFEHSLFKLNYQPYYFCGESYDMEPLHTWHQDRIVLLGDAAHPIGSISALGASTAMEDSKALVNALIQYRDIETALSSYEKTQIPRSIAFLNYERQITHFLIDADQQQYQQFIETIKNTAPEIERQKFFSLLKED